MRRCSPTILGAHQPVRAAHADVGAVAEELELLAIPRLNAAEGERAGGCRSVTHTPIHPRRSTSALVSPYGAPRRPAQPDFAPAPAPCESSVTFQHPIPIPIWAPPCAVTCGCDRRLAPRSPGRELVSSQTIHEGSGPQQVHPAESGLRDGRTGPGTRAGVRRFARRGCRPTPSSTATAPGDDRPRRRSASGRAMMPDR